MINFNGKITNNSAVTIENNRGFLYGDAVFETVKIVNNKILFAEDHYFRLMASMRICRMEIPMFFTLEYFESQILETAKEFYNAKARITFYRDSEGLYLPTNNETKFVISANELSNPRYILNENSYEIDLFKDFFVPKHLLSTLKTTNKLIQITGSIFANENNYQNCLLLNTDKNVVEALQSNIFMKIGTTIITPPLADGCLNGIMRKQVINSINKSENYTIEEQSISPFDLQKADELFLTNVISGIISVTKYRKKVYDSTFANFILQEINKLIP